MLAEGLGTDKFETAKRQDTRLDHNFYTLGLLHERSERVIVEAEAVIAETQAAIHTSMAALLRAARTRHDRPQQEEPVVQLPDFTEAA